MEFLMGKFAPTAIIIAVLALAGCTARNLPRINELHPPGIEYSTSGMEPVSTAGNSFDGRLDLIYEKKIKGSVDSPLSALGDYVVFRSTHDRILVYNRATGHRAAQIKKRHGIVLNTIVADSLLIIVRKAPYGEIDIINLFSGNSLNKLLVRNIRSGPIVVRDELIVGTTDGLAALSFPGLDTLWNVKSKKMVDVSPVSDGPSVYYCDGDRVIRAVRASDGESDWEARFDYSIVSELSVGSFLYFGLADGSMNALDKTTGSIVWTQPIGFQIHGRVAEDESRIFFGGTDGAVYCLSKVTAEVVWHYQTEGIITATPVVYGGAVLVGSHDRYFYSLDRETGELIDRRRLEGPVTMPADVGKGLILVPDRKNRLYCFKG
jgi:hypothetical protein